MQPVKQTNGHVSHMLYGRFRPSAAGPLRPPLMLRPWQERHRHEARHLPRLLTTFLLCTSVTIASVRHPTIGTELRTIKRRRAQHHLPVLPSSRLGVTVAHHRRRLTRAVLTLRLTLRIRRPGLGQGDASPAARRVPPNGRDAGNGHRRRVLPSVPHAAIGRLGPEGGGCWEGSSSRWWGGIGGRARGGVRECGFSFGGGGGGGGWKLVVRRRPRRHVVGAAAARRETADGGGGGPAVAGEHHEGKCGAAVRRAACSGEDEDCRRRISFGSASCLVPIFFPPTSNSKVHLRSL